MAGPALRVLEAHARTYRRSWRGSAASTFLNPLLYLGAMGLGLGSLVDRGSGAGALAGASYVEFLAPGLLAATAMQVAAAETTWPVMLGFKWVKTYTATLATPVAPRDIVSGTLLWTAVRLALAGSAFALVMVLFGLAAPQRAALAVLPAVFTGMAFAGPIAAFTATLRTDYGLSALFRFVVMPLFLFSGTFFPVSDLPGLLQPVAYATPLWHGVELCRAAALGTRPTFGAAVSVAYLAVWVAGGWAAAATAFRRRLRT